MKTFLLNGKKPIVKWGMLPENVFFEGEVPKGYSLGVSPSGKYIVVDVDVHGDINGFDNIPEYLKDELNRTLNYKTKNKGQHYWFLYTGDKKLANRTSGKGIDLRTNKGYVVWYLKKDIRKCLDEINETSVVMNHWLESLFYYKAKKGN